MNYSNDLSFLTSKGCCDILRNITFYTIEKRKYHKTGAISDISTLSRVVKIEYTYYHIETEEDVIIWADGDLTESYLDTGNRHSFRQHGNLVLFNRQSSPKKCDTDAGAPLIIQRSVVEDIYNQITQRATDTGCIKDNDNLPFTNDPDLHLVTKEVYQIYLHFNSEDIYIFLIPEDVETVYLHSRSSRPCDVIGPYIDDRRNLGVLVSDIFIFTYDNTYQMKDYLLIKDLKKWDVIEHDKYLWTNGHVELNLQPYMSQKRIVVIQIIPFNVYIIDYENNVLQEQNID